MLPKIHKRLHDVAGRPVISNCGYFNENISPFLDFHLQPLAQEVKCYIKDTNDFLKKLSSLPKLPDVLFDVFYIILFYVVGLYPNIPHDEGLSALRKRLDLRQKKNVTTSTLVELAEVVLKHNIFTFKEKTLKQKRSTAIAPPYSRLSMTELEEDISSETEIEPYLWWRYMDDIFFLREHGEEKT